jgi:hypothetical protein
MHSTASAAWWLCCVTLGSASWLGRSSGPGAQGLRPVQLQASLIITYSHSGRTASLVAKYRPSMVTSSNLPLLCHIVLSVMACCHPWSKPTVHLPVSKCGRTSS